MNWLDIGGQRSKVTPTEQCIQSQACNCSHLKKLIFKVIDSLLLNVNPSYSEVQVYNKVWGSCSLTAKRWMNHSGITHGDVWMLYMESTVPPLLSTATWDRGCRVPRRGSEWHFKLNWPLLPANLHCVSRATAFPFSAWQYPSFLFISRLSGRRKWNAGLSGRGTGAITGV